MERPSPSFEPLGLCAAVWNALEALHYCQPSPIQQQAIPAVLFGKGVLAIADTGSGKTLISALPILHRSQEETLSIRRPGKPQCNTYAP